LLQHGAVTVLGKLECEGGFAFWCPVNPPVTTIQMTAIKIDIHKTVFAEHGKTGADAAKRHAGTVADIHHFRCGNSEDSGIFVPIRGRPGGATGDQEKA
jgi:hypothetical protein